MKNTLKYIVLLLGFWSGGALVQGQCTFDPTVVGNLLLCPASSTVLSTQSYNSYQWFSRAFPNGTSQAIPGATNPTLEVGYTETPVYISVAATLNGCTEKSPEVLVDGLFFLPVTVLSIGTFEPGPNGQQVICLGDTIYQIAQLPYNTNLQWYNGTDSIPGATDDTLVVTHPGDYWLTGSPAECPNFTAALDSQIHVIWGNTPGCASNASEPHPVFTARISPNPAGASIRVLVESADNIRFTLFNLQGAAVREKTFYHDIEIPTTGLPAGAYLARMQAEHGGKLDEWIVIRRE